MEAGRRTSRGLQLRHKSEEKGLKAGAQRKAKRPHSGGDNDGISTAERVHSLPTQEKRRKRWGESEISDEEETDDEINDPQYLPDPDSDSDSDGDSTNRLAKLKLPGNNRNQGDSKIQSAAVRGRRGRGGGTNICFLCQKEFPRIDAHLKTHMSEDADIAQAFGLPAGSKQRKELLEKLRNRGNSLRDGEVLKTQCEGKTNAKRKSCVHCKGMFSPYRLSTHVMNCSSKPEEKQQQEEEPELVILACSSDVRNDGVLKILGHLHEDVARALSSDPSLDLFSKSLYSLHGHDPAKHNYIRQKILELGRFLLAMRKTSPVLTLADVVKPANFLNMVKVVKEITGFDTAQEIPSHALRIGQSLFEVSDIVQCQALLIGDQELVNSTTEFKKLYQAKWPEYISQSALTAVVDLTDGSPTAPDVDGLTAQLDGRVEQAAEQNCPSPARQQTHQTANKPSELPPAEDVGMLHNHLDHKAKSAAAALKEQPTAENYSSLARATLSKMVLLNHEQVSELSKMKLQNFLERECLNKLEEVGLTEYEQKLCCYFQRVGLKGSGGREVAALLTPPLVTALDLLIGKRRECGVPDDNDYLFAVPKCQTYYRGHQSLGLFADKCGAQRPDYLRSARLRKRVAIASRIVSFRDHELDRLSTFLGQEVEVQRRFCWLSEPNEQSARISTLLQALEKGKLHQVQEKSPVGFEEFTDDEKDDDEKDDDEKDDDEKDDDEKDDDEKDEREAEESPAGDATTDEVDSPKKIPKMAGKRNCVRGRKKWTVAEIGAVMRHFSSNIENGYTATREECETCKESEHPVLQNRTFRNIRDFVRNRVVAFKRQLT